MDDGSTDETPRVLADLTAVHPQLRSLRLATSAGQSAALVAGFRAARGDWIATLDADLQNDPRDLVTLWAALPGHDVALGWRVKREDSWTRRAISRWANRVRNMVLGQSIRDTGCSVRIFPRAVALELPLFKGAHRFLGPLFLSAGCRLIQVPVNHRPRPHGRSHYNLWNRSLRVVFDLFGVAWLIRRSMRYQVLENQERQHMSTRPAHGLLIPRRESQSEKTPHVKPERLAGRGFSRPVALHCAVRGAMARIGEESRLGCARGILVV